MTRAASVGRPPRRDVARRWLTVHPFLVPLAAIPADSLRVEVVDVEGADGGEAIGAVRLSAAEALAALRSPTHIQTEAAAWVWVALGVWRRARLRRRVTSRRRPEPGRTSRRSARCIAADRSPSGQAVGRTDRRRGPYRPTRARGRRIDAAQRRRNRERGAAAEPVVAWTWHAVASHRPGGRRPHRRCSDNARGSPGRAGRT